MSYAKVKPTKNDKPFIDKTKQNKAGYYEGMPGVKVDDYGNRIMAYFAITPEGNSAMVCNSMDVQIKKCIQNAMDEQLTRAIVQSAAVDYLFNKKNPFHFFLRTAYKTKIIMQRLKNRRNMKRKLKADGKA